MLFRKISIQKCLTKMSNLIYRGVLTILFIFSLFSCTLSKGEIVILEDGNGTGFTMSLKEYNFRNKCELSLNKGDVVQIEIEHEGGIINFTVTGKRGSEPYTGNDMKSGIFTITVSETDDYIFSVRGKAATGDIIVKIINNAAASILGI